MLEMFQLPCTKGEDLRLIIALIDNVCVPFVSHRRHTWSGPDLPHDLCIHVWCPICAGAEFEVHLCLPDGTYEAAVGLG